MISCYVVIICMVPILLRGSQANRQTDRQAGRKAGKQGNREASRRSRLWLFGLRCKLE
uniref:Small EDRK-rich factor-like N-terminal domain-containing protein n=1 Tax=Glossina palpalis gambiensis TaxID=67801 RepID=A0A1B0AL30_9MUSC